VDVYLRVSIISTLALFCDSPAIYSSLLDMNDFKVLTKQTGGAVFGALAGGNHSTSNHEREPL